MEPLKYPISKCHQCNGLCGKAGCGNLWIAFNMIGKVHENAASVCRVLISNCLIACEGKFTKKYTRIPTKKITCVLAGHHTNNGTHSPFILFFLVFFLFMFLFILSLFLLFLLTFLLVPMIGSVSSL